jgi:ribosome biogenesis GTPase A
MSRFGWVVHKVIEKSDIILEVLDARFINETINRSVGLKVRNKMLIHVINKSDYVDARQLGEVKRRLKNCVFVSAKKRTGIPLLKRMIKKLAKERGLSRVIVGVVGYPNVGKSTLINTLRLKNCAKTSPEAGYTKGMQYIKVSNGILMIDTPGVIAEGITNEKDLVLIGAKNPYTIKDPDIAVMQLMEQHPGLIEKKYEVKIRADKEGTINAIAIKLNFKKKGNLPDIDRASRKILQDWTR